MSFWNVTECCYKNLLLKYLAFKTILSAGIIILALQSYRQNLKIPLNVRYPNLNTLGSFLAIFCSRLIKGFSWCTLPVCILWLFFQTIFFFLYFEPGGLPLIRSNFFCSILAFSSIYLKFVLALITPLLQHLVQSLL